MKKIHIQLEKEQKIWFTSDMHIGHRNVIRFCNRPWTDEKEMCEGLINSWNSLVGDNDIVFVLGDTFWFNDSRMIKKVIDRLKGKTIYILPGNHDDFSHYHRVDTSSETGRIVLCQDVVVLWLQEANGKTTEIWMSHYPMMTWPHRVNGAWQLFGHIHSNAFRTEGVDQDLPLHWNQHDVGCDYWGYRPVDFETLQRLFDARKTRNSIK
jgi:calcineurin-like phosphoesterase family protein